MHFEKNFDLITYFHLCLFPGWRQPLHLDRAAWVQDNVAHYHRTGRLTLRP